ncbi:MAG: YolD-like family protein [Clostridia bacterium]|nr:YolD-like family protein [Clostridia bacterium]
MNREDRARQFLPFDALKGLQEELRKREKTALRTDRRQLSEEEAEKLSERLLRLQKGMRIEACYYDGGYYRTCSGEVLTVDTVHKVLFLTVSGEKLAILFYDLYRLRIL